MKRGDQKAFASIIDKCLEPSLLTAIRLVSSKEDAEDIVQECFIKLWEKRESIKDGASFIPWIRKIVINRCYDFLRSEKRKRDLMKLIPFAGNDPVGDYESDRNLSINENNEILKRISESMSPRQRVVFVLSEIEQMTYSEIAESTGMSRFSVKSNVYHAREKAKAIFKIVEI